LIKKGLIVTGEPTILLPGFALRDIRREDVMDEEIDELLKASETILTILARIQRRKERGAVKKLVI
jgi:hypothetical protein